MTALYVVGFLLDDPPQHVLLIRKNRPAWQAGKLNGVGGKVELDRGETPADAIAREFQEETGLETTPADWERFCTITWPDDEVRVNSAENTSVVFYRRREADPARFWGAKAQTDEQLRYVLLDRIHDRDVIPNLRWLLPLAAYTADRYAPFTVQATCMEA